MAKILTGIQSTGTPHLGNLLGAILPAIELSKKPENETFLFIADLHSITQIKDGETLRDDQNYMYVSTWEYTGYGKEPVKHKEPLQYEFIKIATRNYKD